MKRRGFLGGAGAMLIAPMARAEEMIAKTINNANALSGDRFEAAGIEYQLADIMAPKLYTLDNIRPAYFENSRKALAVLLADGVDLLDVAAPTRWGVHVVRARRVGQSGMIAEALVRDGAARVAPVSDDYASIEKLLRLEAEARDGKRGLWAAPDYRVYAASAARGAIGDYHLIEGVIATAEKHGSRLYLNFGADYRMDFTASAAGRLASRWAKGGIDLASLAGASVRVRGFVQSINGPSIDLTHQLQVETLA